MGKKGKWAAPAVEDEDEDDELQVRLPLKGSALQRLGLPLGLGNTTRTGCNGA
jgi:hypothetical protein